MRTSHYESIKHPNLDETVVVEKGHWSTYLLGAGNPDAKGGFENSAFAKWFANFDEEKLRPFLIRNYTYDAV